jgi:hypothetical protein
VQYFIAGLQAKDVLFQKSIIIVKLLDGFSKPIREAKTREGYISVSHKHIEGLQI